MLNRYLWRTSTTLFYLVTARHSAPYSSTAVAFSSSSNNNNKNNLVKKPAERMMKPHDGEEYVQDRRGVPESFRAMTYRYTSRDMPYGQDSFYTNLDYLAISTTDSSARPWATLLVLAGTDANISYTHKNRLDISCSLPVDDPFAKAVMMAVDSTTASSSLLFAAVGVDFVNRNRAKVQGNIRGAAIKPASDDDDRVLVNLQLETTEHLGNCPKYITVRNLQHLQRAAPKAVVFDNKDGGGGVLLDERCKDVISKSSSIWMATRHLTDDQESDLGLNHRGGVPGFVRCYDDNTTTTIVVPDYSGNRFYQSLGNVQTDKVAGLLFVDFQTGDMLHVTGEANNLFDDEAEAIMPRTTLVTTIRVTGAVLLPGGLNLELVGSAETLSPYNPPIRYLADELRAMGQPVPTTTTTGSATNDDNSNKHEQQATLIGIKKLTDDISTFEFRLDKPVSIRPGGYAVFDFSAMLNREYSHMSEDNPQRINDDYIRTWTVSSAPAYFDVVTNQFHETDCVQCTIRRTGVISSLLHSMRDKPKATAESKIRFVGTGGSFSPFPSDDDGSDTMSNTPSKMVWIAGGIGITPFMAMWDGLVKSKSNTEVVLLFACRGDSDMALLESIQSSSSSENKGPSIQIQVFDSASSSSSLNCPDNKRVTIHPRRMNAQDIMVARGKTAFVCGPTSLNKAATEWLASAGAAKIVTEDFTF